jgi:hypothetical protein
MNMRNDTQNLKEHVRKDTKLQFYKVTPVSLERWGTKIKNSKINVKETNFNNKQVDYLITTLQRNCGLRSLLLKMNKIRQCYQRQTRYQRYDTVIREYCCAPTMTSVSAVTTMRCNDLSLNSCNNVSQ